MSVIIDVHQVSKQYRLGQVGTGTLSHDINRWWHLVRGKEDPYLKIGETNDRTTKGNSNYVWALRDVSFQVNQGDVVGIIGRNGAGKSTLLKILSRTTTPTTGHIRFRGRIASLLEVGTGFHPELSGRDNIYLNGAILGMTKQEITRKFDEIVDFSGVERYIDTPVKRYSSGMYVRLAFAVAAHLEPEILIVDEVLAVGDAEFQKKALGKMKDVSSNGGRTVLFVSHNMAVIENLCTQGVYMHNGQVAYAGEIRSTIEKYLLRGGSEVANARTWDSLSDAPGNQFIRLMHVSVEPIRGSILDTLSGLRVKVRIHNTKQQTRIGFNMQVFTQNEVLVFTTGQVMAFHDSKQGFYEISYEISQPLLNDGIYKTKIWFGEHGQVLCLFPEDTFTFEVMPKVAENGINPERLSGITMPNPTYSIQFSA